MATLPGNIEHNVKIEIYDVNKNQLVDIIEIKNRLVLRYHLVMTHFLSPVGNPALQQELSPADFSKYGIPTDADLKIRKMRFGTDPTQTEITMSGLIALVEPGFYPDGTTIPPNTQDWYDIDTYKFGNGSDVNGVKDYDQNITFEATMAGVQGNSTTTTPIVYREAGLFTNNNIMFARTTFPSITKTEDLALKFSWNLSLP